MIVWGFGHFNGAFWSEYSYFLPQICIIINQNCTSVWLGKIIAVIRQVRHTLWIMITVMSEILWIPLPPLTIWRANLKVQPSLHCLYEERRKEEADEIRDTRRHPAGLNSRLTFVLTYWVTYSSWTLCSELYTFKPLHEWGNARTHSRTQEHSQAGKVSTDRQTSKEVRIRV